MKRCKSKSILFSVLLVFCCHLAWSQQIIKGKVIDNEQNPIVGGNIIVKGTTIGSTTDINGSYSLNAPDLNGTLVFSYIGYVTDEVPINNRTTVDITMVPDIQSLGEVVITGLGIKREQKSLGYATSTVTAKDLTYSGNTNFASALYGKAAGVKITTAPGGATSAVNVQIRGINSLNFNAQPLYVVDGILIRNSNEKGAKGINNDGYWEDQRIRGNGILDINPSDIESLTVLKGAGATALYGSEAASGVIVITTKKGTKNAGLGVDINYTYNTEKVAFTPKYQNTYGPGYDRETNLAIGATEEGWVPVDLDGDGVRESFRPIFTAFAQFGPKMEGQMVPWWDGKTRPYKAHPDNYKDFYQRGYSSIFNASISNQTDKGAFRLSYTRNDYEGVQVGGKLERNTFNLNSTLKLHDKLSTDIVINYVNSKTHNRPMQINRISGSYDGFFSRAEDMSVYFDKYKTSNGYKWVPYNQTARNPQEALAYNVRPELLNFLWSQLRNSEDEAQDRLITSATLNYQILKNLRFRGRIGNDFTGLSIETKQYNEYPISFNGSNSTGRYAVSNGRYSILYGDALLTYSKDITPDFNISVNGGFQSRDEKYRDQSSNTEGGLITENWFTLTNSFAPLKTSSSRSTILKYAFLGFLNLSYKDYLFLEGTARQEYSSTLPPGNNSYFYPSVNGSFVFSDAFNLPSLLSYGKLRASYGVVGNAPPAYVANVSYTQNPLQTISGSVPSLSAQGEYGNDDIKPENKYEMEFGLEARVLNNRLGADLTYYNSRIVDQITRLSLPSSTGAGNKLVNIGELRSTGWELALNATPIKGTLTWDARINFATTSTKVHKLMEGVDRVVYFDAEQSAIRIVAEKGESIGNIYVYPRAKDENGNLIINEYGLYTINKNTYEKAGNVLPKVAGGFANTISFKGFTLDVMVDYRFGGKIVSTPLKYATGAGMYENTMKYRDAENGGLPYYIDNNTKILLPDHNAAAPNGGKVYHDGLVLKGVTESGEPNTTVVDAAAYYINMFYWGADAWNEEGAVYDNSYIKLREASLGYTLPKSFSDKLRMRNVRVSIIGRNLFYIWRTLKNLDPEAPIGSSWLRQGLDEGSSAATRSYGVSINASF